MRKLLTSLVVAGSLVCAVVIPSAANAAPAADQSQTISSNVLGNGFYCSSSTPSPTDELEEGSNFTAGASGYLSSFDLPIHFTVSPGDMVASLYETSNNIPTGTALATQTIPAATVAAISHATLNVAFSAPAVVTAGHTYAFTLKFAACGGGLQQIDYMIGDAPADKQITTYVNGAWTTQALRGIAFTTYVSPVEVAATPDPTLVHTGISDSTPISIVVGLGLLVAGVAVFGVTQRAASRRRD